MMAKAKKQTHSLVDDVAGVLDDMHTRYHLILISLKKAGQQAVSEVVERISLREAAKRVGLSATYLSQVKNGRAAISPRAFYRVYNLLQTLKGKNELPR
jgi:hypothetical protein